MIITDIDSSVVTNVTVDGGVDIYTGVRAGDTWEFSVPLFNFATNRKLL